MSIASKDSGKGTFLFIAFITKKHYFCAIEENIVNLINIISFSNGKGPKK